MQKNLKWEIQFFKRRTKLEETYYFKTYYKATLIEIMVPA